MDDSRYCRESMASFIPRPSVRADGRWMSAQTFGVDDSEYLCDDHLFLGWIPEHDLFFHCTSASHDAEHTMSGPWRAMR